jgi:hypothetical protein
MAAEAIAPAPTLAQLNALERRVGEIVRDYDRQGDHRTGSDVDRASARWLVGLARDCGATATLEEFDMQRVEPVSCFVRIGDRRIEGVPLFDAGFTNSQGVTGSLGSLGSSTVIGVATMDTTMAAPSGGPKTLRDQIASSAHKAVVLLTKGKRPGLSLSNATHFEKPFGPPVVQVSDSESEWLGERVARGAEAIVVAEVARHAARACNVTAELAGADPRLAPIVISTPRSGWWQCAGERGGGIACWLETLRALSSAPKARSCLFAAVTGHELGFLGLRDYLARRPGLLQRCDGWIHFGANLGVPRQALRLQASDEALAESAASRLERGGVSVSARNIRPPNPRGEAGLVQAGGARYVAPICGSEFFHHPSDRWPEALDAAALARRASAFSSLALSMVQQ